MAIDWGSVGGGALTGGAAGAPLGPWGAAGGAILGGLTGLFGGGKKSKTKKLPTLSPEQQRYQNFTFQQAMQPNQGFNMAQQRLQDLLNPNSQAYQDLSQPYLDEFDQEFVPQMAERFAGAGALSSSAFAQSLGAGKSKLATTLAALRQNIQNQASQGIFDLYNSQQNRASQQMGISPYDYQTKQATTGFGQNALQGLVSNQNFGGILSGVSNLFGPKQGGSTTQYPLTAGYDAQFRNAGVF